MSEGGEVPDFSEAVIEAVRKHPSLWDKKSKDYAKKKSVKELDWQKVAQECGSDASSVKEKWRSLRDYYVARRRKIPASGSAASEGGRQLGRYGRLLSFLDPVTQRGLTTSSAMFPAPTGEPTPAHPGAPVPGTSGREATQGSESLRDEIFFADESQILDVDEEVDVVNVDAETETGTEQRNDTASQSTQLHNHQTQQNSQPQHATQNTQPPSQQSRNTQQAQLPSTSAHNTTLETPTTSQRASKRKVSDIDGAIMNELARGRVKDTDRDYTFCMNVYAELKFRSEATKKLIKRKISAALDEHDD